MSEKASPVLTAAQMAEVDRLMVEVYGIAVPQTMENAGRNLAEQARRMLGGRLARRKVTVLCGGGHNGGAGLAGARHLHNRGAEVTVILAANPARLKKFTAQQWWIVQAMGLDTPEAADLTQADLIVDALVGYGLKDHPRPTLAPLIEQVNASGRPVLSLDAPSGLDTTSGAPGRPCIEATATLTLAIPKRGLLALAAKTFVGELYLADVSVPPDLYRRIGIELGPLFVDDTILRIL